MKLSKSTRREPTQTKTLQNEYVKALQKLFRAYKKGVLNTFDSAVEYGSQMAYESELVYNNKYSSLEIINREEIAHIDDLDEYDRLAKWEHVPRTRTHILKSAEIDLIFFDNTLRQYGVQLVTNGAPITEEFARKSFSSGTMYGYGALKRIGVESVVTGGPADWRVIDALKVRNLTALRGITDETNKQIIKELTDGIQLGESIPKLRDRIAGRVDHIGKTRATVMARTEAINAFTQGAELRYAQAGIEKLEWLTAGDGRVCPICGPLNGKVFSVKSRHERPPIHPNCRCTIIPVLE